MRRFDARDWFVRGTRGRISARDAQSSTVSTRSTRGSHSVVDETGRHVTVPVDVRRIVSLAPNLTETVYALGEESWLAGDTDFCDFPPDAEREPHVGSVITRSRAIVGLKPDLVLATKTINRPETAEALEDLGLPVYSPIRIGLTIYFGMEHLRRSGIRRKGRELVARFAGSDSPRSNGLASNRVPASSSWSGTIR